MSASSRSPASAVQAQEAAIAASRTDFQSYVAAEATAQANIEQAKADLKRFVTLGRQDSIAQQIYDNQKYLVHQYEGNVEADQANIDTAKLSLVYSRITAPESGRVGLRLVDPVDELLPELSPACKLRP